MSKRRKIIHEHLDRQGRETISRPRLLTHPLLGGCSLRSQLGNNANRHLPPDPNEYVAAYYAASLSENVIYDSALTVPGFVVDERNGAIMLAHSSGRDDNAIMHCLRPTQPRHYCGMSHLFEAMPGSFGDMSISVQLQKLMYISNDPRGTSTVLLDLPKLDDTVNAGGALNHVWNFYEETAWQTTASSQGESFAVASSSGLRLYRMLAYQMSITGSLTYPNPDACEYMAVAFGQDDRTTMAGERSGTVKFFDARTQHSVSRLRHEDAVGAIRLIDDNRLVVRGLQKVRYQLRHFRHSKA